MAEERADGLLILEVRAKRGEKVTAVRGLLTKLVVGATDGASPLFARRIAIDGREKAPFEFRVPIPAGEYGKLTLGLAELVLTTVEDEEEKVPLVQGESTFPVALNLSPGAPTRVVLYLSLDKLRGAKAPGDVLAVALDDAVREQAFEAPQGEAATLRLGLSAVSLGARSLPGGTKIVLRAPKADDLPPLFRGQARVGEPLEVRSTIKLSAPAEVTVPYDAARLAAAGVSPDEALVLQLDDARTVYRELKPLRVDPRAGTLTVRVRSFSIFFAGTPGIEIQTPELAADGFGRVLGFVAGDTATIAGRATDPNAQVALLRPAVPSTWAHGGWFDFESVPLPGPELSIAIEARVEGQLPHVREFLLRKAIVPRRITDPRRPFGAGLAILANDEPRATTVVAFDRFTGEGLTPSLAEWQRSYNRLGPFLFRPNDDRSGWIFAHLLAETFFEEQAAALAIRLLAPRIEVPILPAAPEETRALASLSAFAAGLIENDLRRPSIGRALDLARPLFDRDTLSVSPRVPLVPLGGERLGAAFVAATLAATDEALDSALSPILRDLYGSFSDHVSRRPSPRAGRLFWAEGEFDSIGREAVADGIWCAGVSVALDPQTGRPAIAAIGVAPDVHIVRADGVHADEPRSRVLLYRRAEDGTWSEEVVLADRPVVDVDLAIGEDGEARLVASVAATADFPTKAHVVAIRRAAEGWRATPLSIEVEIDGRTHRTDRGLWPRIAIDGRGRSVVVFAEWLAVWRWHVAVETPGGFRARRIREARWLDLAGSPLPPSPVRLDVPPAFGDVSVAHWAAAIALDGSTALWCAYPNGMLQLARIDLETLDVEDSPVAVDRATGFFPALAVRRDGAPAIVYKDTSSPDGGDGDLFFLSTDDGAIVPHARFGPLLPPFEAGILSTREFAPHVPLDCATLKDMDSFPSLLASIVRDRRFHLEIYPDGGLGLPSYLAFAHSHPRLFERLQNLAALPTVLVIAIDNRDFPLEGIERVVITAFPEPVLRVPLATGVGLDDGAVPPSLVAALGAQGLALHPGFLTVTVTDRGNSWQVVDARASASSLRTFSQLYTLRRGSDPETQADVIEVHLPAVLSIVARGDVPRDDAGRPVPCDTEQEDWDLLAGPLIQRFAGSPIQIPRDTPGRIVFFAMRDLRVTRVAPRDPQGSDQQGGVRFSLEIPTLVGRNEDPGANLYSVEPSRLFVTFAPSVVRGRIAWWLREAELRLGRVEVDADVGPFDFLRVLAGLIPGFGFLLLAADPVVDLLATSAVNDSLAPPDTASFQGLFRDALQGWTDAALGEGFPPIESAYLRDGTLQIWTRSARAERSHGAAIEILPSPALSFPTVRLGEEPARRNLLLTSVGGVPSLLRSVRLLSGEPEMRIDGPAPGPLVLEPGAAITVPLVFDPQSPPGFRAGQLEVMANAGPPVLVDLHGIVAAPLVPRLRLRPSNQLSFALVTVGTRREEPVEILNDGSAPLVLAPPRIEGDAAVPPVFSLAAPALTIAPGASAIVRVAYAPPVGGPSRHDARLVLESNDPQEPRVELPVAGFAAGLGSVFVQATSLVFNTTIIEANQPPLPPGLPPTVHLGSTRTTTVVNLGPGPLTVLAATFRIPQPNGTPSPHFRLWLADGSAPAPVDRVLQGGQSLALVVQFLPTVAGSHQATLTIRTGDPVQPAIAVSLAGVGVV